MVVGWLVVVIGGGAVWGGVGISAGEQLSEKGVCRDAGGAIFHVGSMVVRVLSCGSRFVFGVNARNYLLGCWVSKFLSGKILGVDWRNSKFGLPYEASWGGWSGLSATLEQ